MRAAVQDGAWKHLPSRGSIIQGIIVATLFALRFTIFWIAVIHVALITAIIVSVERGLRSAAAMNELKRAKEQAARTIIAQSAAAFVTVCRNFAAAVAAAFALQGFPALTGAIVVSSFFTALGTETVSATLAKSIATHLFGMRDGTAASGSTAAGGDGDSTAKHFVVVDGGPLSGVQRRGCLLRPSTQRTETK